MSKCFDAAPVLGCFIPNNGSAKESVMIHTTYNSNGNPHKTYATSLDSETPIDPATYLGGGTLVIGECPCVTPAEFKCLKKRNFRFFYDNGITPGSSTNDGGMRPDLIRFNGAFEVVGWETNLGVLGAGETIGPATGWTAQLTEWFNFGADNYPSTQVKHSFSFTPAPTWRAWVLEGCDPTAQFGIWTIRRDDGIVYKVYPRGYTESYEYVWCVDTIDCQGNPTQIFYERSQDSDTSVITWTELTTPPTDIDCFVDCDRELPSVILEGAVSPCETKEYCVLDSNNNDIELVLFIIDCGETRTRIAYTKFDYDNADSPDIPEYDLTDASLLSCDGGEFIEPPCEGFEPPVFTEQTCFLPDQYAITWAWNGSGDVMSFNPITQQWTDYGKTTLPDGTVVGGYSMDINNNTNNPLVVYQVRGKLYTAPLNNPTSLTEVGPANNSQFGGSYPCGAFRPGTEEFWVGIGSGSTVGIADLTTGNITTLGSLKDNRDGAALQAGPGDWFFDPEGNLFLMARDTRGATFGESTGTVLWKIDPVSLCVDRIGNTDAPSSGTGASWLAAGSYLLSAGSTIYTYRPSLDPAPGSTTAWTQEIPSAPYSINDLGNQWIVPESIPVFVCYEKNKDGQIESSDLFTLEQDEDDPTINKVVPFEITIPGTWGKCESTSNPFVTDPVSGGGSSSELKPTDKVWNEGCSQDGIVLWREDCNGSREYIYGSDSSPKIAPPEGFLPYRCETIQRVTDTRPFCLLESLDGNPVKTVYQQEEVLTQVITWFDETGSIPEPEYKTPGECPPSDEETTVSDTIICIDGKTYIRRRTDNLADNGTGLLEPITYEIIIFNGEGTLYSSGVTLITDDINPEEPEYEVGDCVLQFITTERDTYCEISAKFLLLIDSGGGFARYSFLTKTWSNVSTLSVASAGGSADVENRILYNFVAPNQITRVDVNTDTQLPNMTVVDGNINPAVTTNPKTFSAASFREADGKLYAQDTGGNDAGLYCVNVSSDPNVTSATVDFVTTISGVSGAGTSIMIDNSTDTLIVNGSNLSYDVNWTTGIATVWGNPPIQPNGGTFDTEGNAYVTQNDDTYCLPAGSDPNDTSAWQQIIDDWTPGANSIAYYEVDAPEPPEFECRYGVQADGTRIPLGTFETGCGNENIERSIVGEIVPCSYLEREKLSEIASNTASGGSNSSFECADETTQSIETGTGNIPAGLKSVTINSITGVTTVAGGYELGSGRRSDSISLSSSDQPCINGVLPAITISGGSWQWIGIR